MFGIDQAFTRLEPVAIHDGRQSRDGDPFAQIRVDVLSKSLKVGHDGGLTHKSIRFVAVVGKVGKSALPIWCDKAERIPALLIPGEGNTMFFEDKGADSLLL